MKKQLIIILCCVFALGTGIVMAKSNNILRENSPELSYSINIGDVSGLNAEALKSKINEAISIYPEVINGENAAKCSITVELNIKVVKVSITVEDDCATILKTLEQVCVDTKETISKIF